MVEPDAAAVRCQNPDCPTQLQRRLGHFAGKAGVEINGLGESIVAELVTRNNVRNPVDLYRLQKADLLKLPAFGEKSATQLLAEIERSRRAELWRFINGLGIPRVGPAAAKVLARHFGSLEKFAVAHREDFPRTLAPAVVASLENYLGAKTNRIAVQALAVEVRPGGPANVPSKLTGKIFVLTGRLPTLSREEATRRIEAAGGVVRNSVAKSTDYVVAGDDAGEKLARANTLSVTVIGEAELLRLLTD